MRVGPAEDGVGDIADQCAAEGGVEVEERDELTAAHEEIPSVEVAVHDVVRQVRPRSFEPGEMGSTEVIEIGEKVAVPSPLEVGSHLFGPSKLGEVIVWLRRPRTDAAARLVELREPGAYLSAIASATTWGMFAFDVLEDDGGKVAEKANIFAH